jgi:Mg/Co/Ni transporter MgtE
MGKLIGRITIDDVVDVIREQADHSLAVMAGLGDGDAFTPVLSTAPQRAVWLAINLATAILAASVIGVFQDTIEKVVGTCRVDAHCRIHGWYRRHTKPDCSHSRDGDGSD